MQVLIIKSSKLKNQKKKEAEQCSFEDIYIKYVKMSEN